jgi:3'-phosphoadenosine 5'-phosphosulfate sulfotransferase (PAPS reductase)/FAD synthetase
MPALRVREKRGTQRYSNGTQQLSFVGVRSGSIEFSPVVLDSYQHIIVFFSGGKDSLACLLRLLDLGVPAHRIELWHHEVDGREGSTLMDWPCTAAYCQAVAEAFGVRLWFSWKAGGFEGEMLRDDTATAAMCFETEAGVQVVGGDSAQLGTRLKFPQTSGDLRVRWCSPYLKIDVAARAITSQGRFDGVRTLVISGERAEESPNRAKYKSFEKHRTSNSKRHVDHWRPVHRWSEQEVWQIIQHYRVNPHPAYRLGWGRVSCAACIFGNADQWASLALANPQQVERIAQYEEQFGFTIQRKKSIRQLIARGTPYLMDESDIQAALATEFSEPVLLAEGQWQLPRGAYGDSTGPT